MPAVKPPAKILVTGASGFLGAHVARSFLARGYDVRGTVRSADKGDYLQKLFSSDYPGQFEYAVVGDIGEPGAFDEAVKGVDAIAHTASPVVFSGPGEDPDQLIKPAVEGTLGVFRSAAAHGPAVRRIVVTSSFATMLEPHGDGYVYSEDDWNKFSITEVEKTGAHAHGVHKYRASKSLAELALLAFVKDNAASIKFDTATVHPPFIYGPMIHEVKTLEAMNLSTAQLWNALKTPEGTSREALGAYLGNHIDVRDVAEVHVDALEREEFAGKRFIIGCGALSTQDILDAANSLPAGSLPALPFVISKGIPGATDETTRKAFVQISPRSQKILGREFIQLPQIIKDTVWSVKKLGLLD